MSLLLPRDAGAALLARADVLAAHSDAPPGPDRPLTVAYLTPAHQACARQLAAWMREDGFDEAGVDAVGNVVGVLRGTDPVAPRLLTGSHYDTVRNAGRFDGRLGILVALAAVRALREAGRRLPFDLELVAFAEEEGLRFPVTFLGSSALAGCFDPAWLTLRDADGISLREALVEAGHVPEEIFALRREPARYRGFVEVHIEQGPVLDALGLPLGVVSAINGSLRYRGEFIGLASHAGTTPMDRRRDAALGAAELALFVERRAAAAPGGVGTVGQLEVPGGSVNVVPGRCLFSLDLRAPDDAARDALAADVLGEMEAIAQRRGLGHRLERIVQAGAAPCDPGLRRHWEAAVAACGLPVHGLVSGAGHDAMKLHEVMPQAMLFVRGGNAGISHNPLEIVSAEDAQAALAAFMQLLESLAQEKLSQ